MQGVQPYQLPLRIGVSPHDNALCAAGLMRYGFVREGAAGDHGPARRRHQPCRASARALLGARPPRAAAGGGLPVFVLAPGHRQRRRPLLMLRTLFTPRPVGAPGQGVAPPLAARNRSATSTSGASPWPGPGSASPSRATTSPWKDYRPSWNWSTRPATPAPGPEPDCYQPRLTHSWRWGALGADGWCRVRDRAATMVFGGSGEKMSRSMDSMMVSKLPMACFVFPGPPGKSVSPVKSTG